MKTIVTAAALLALAGCTPAAVPAGGNESANGSTATSNGSGGQAANGAAGASAAPAAGAATVDRAYLVGRWTDNGDCSNATEFAESGQFQTSSGMGGLWNLAGDRLTLTGSQTVVMQLVVIDQNTLNIVNANGSIGRSTRC